MMVYSTQNNHLAVQFVVVKWFIMGIIFTQKRMSVNLNLENIVVRIAKRIPKNPPLFSENY